MTSRHALRLLLILCVPSWLGACGAKSQIVRQPQVIKMPVETYVPLPTALTTPLAEPPAPAARCRMPNGTPAVCVVDALAQIPLWRAVVHQCNADRATAAQAGAHP